MPAETPDTRAAPVAGGTAPVGPAAQGPRRLGLVLAVIATAQLMIILDLTIVTVAPPHIQAALHFSGSNLEWVVNAYTEPAGFLGVDLGDATVQRVVGGRVTPAVLRDVAYISYLTETKTPDGPWWELAVIHHTDCGSTLLADPELRRGFAARGGYVEAELAWLPATDPAATVRADVNTLVTAPQLSPNIMVSGYVYNTAAGTLDTIVDPTPVSEIRVLRYLPTNLTAPEIARELYVSRYTVKTHVRNVYAKLGAHGRAEAVARARDLGLLAPSARRP